MVGRTMCVRVFFFSYMNWGDEGCLNPSVTKKEQMEPEGEWGCSCSLLGWCAMSPPSLVQPGPISYHR